MRAFVILMVIVYALAITTQRVLATSWSTEIEDWLNGEGDRWAIFCESASRVYQYIPLIGNPQLIKIYDQLLPICDNNLLIIYKDVCPSHDNGFKVCGEPMVYQYLSERKLLSAKTHMEWKVPTPEIQDQAKALLRSFTNELPPLTSAATATPTTATAAQGAVQGNTLQQIPSTPDSFKNNNNKTLQLISVNVSSTSPGEQKSKQLYLTLQ